MNERPYQTYEQALTVVSRLFCETFNQTSVAAEDDFFALGGDSLMAEALITAINIKFIVAYDVSNIMDNPTPGAFARDLSRGGTKDDLIRLVPGVSGTEPFIYLHGAFGDNYQHRHFGDAFRARWNIVGIRASGALLGEKPHNTLDEMVVSYKNLTKEYFGKYPAILAGNCAGGLLVLELAKRIYDETGMRLTVMVMDPPGTFLEHQQNKSWWMSNLQSQACAQYFRITNAVLVALGLGNSRIAKKQRKQMLFHNIRRFARSVYPDPFPCNLLVFTSSKFIDVTLPGFQKWAHKDSFVRGVPLAGIHNRIHSLNQHQVDRDIIDFVAEVKSKNLYHEAE